jgi:hypothetical protein
MVEAFPEDSAPRYLLRDRDKIYGEDFHKQIQGMGITEVKIAPQSPWQSPFVKRLVGSVRRECLDHVICAGRAASTQDLNKLRRLLSAVQNPLVPEQRCSHFPVGFTGQVQEKSWSSPGRRCPPSVRTGRCLTKAPPQAQSESPIRNTVCPRSDSKRKVWGMVSPRAGQKPRTSRRAFLKNSTTAAVT